MDEAAIKVLVEKLELATLKRQRQLDEYLSGQERIRIEERERCIKIFRASAGSDSFAQQVVDNAAREIRNLK